MKYFITAIIAVVLIASASFAGLNAKVGLAGGAGRISLEKGPLSIGYGYNSEYSLISAALSVSREMANKMKLGLSVTYSSYSELVQNIVGVNTLTDKAGIGGKLFVRKPINQKLFAEVGYDTRMGALVEIGMCLKK